MKWVFFQTSTSLLDTVHYNIRLLVRFPKETLACKIKKFSLTCFIKDQLLFKKDMQEHNYLATLRTANMLM